MKYKSSSIIPTPTKKHTCPTKKERKTYTGVVASSPNFPFYKSLLPKLMSTFSIKFRENMNHISLPYQNPGSSVTDILYAKVQRIKITDLAKKR